MDNDFCNCQDWEELKKNNATLFMIDPIYGWIIRWIELKKDNEYTKIDTYGMKINFCPMCGSKLQPLGG